MAATGVGGKTSEALLLRLFELVRKVLKWLLFWSLSSEKACLQNLQAAEKKLLGHLATPCHTYYVDIGGVVGESDRIWTLAMNTEEQKHVPLLALHGCGSGLGSWLLNLDDLARQRPVYAIDMLGFGRSSRPRFSAEADICNLDMVLALEAWRERMHLPQMILMGHCFGCFVAVSYALAYPERVKHLVLVEPWGFEATPPKALGMLNKISCNPRLKEGYRELLGDDLHHYLEQCNAAAPSGELAFQTLEVDCLIRRNWLRKSLLERTHELPTNLGFSFVGQAESAMESQPHLATDEGSGHYVHLEQPEEFNEHVLNIFTSIEV